MAPISKRMRDPVNQPNIDFVESRGQLRLGLLKSREWAEDPRRFLFSLARYKFVAKMLSEQEQVLEIGCGDAFNAPILLQEVQALTVTDFDPLFIEDTKARMLDEFQYEALVHDFLDGPLGGRLFSAAYSLDVLEHIARDQEDVFLANICANLRDDGVLIVGMPSLESQSYASPGSKAGHVNCKSMPKFRDTMRRHFANVFMFSMNDELVHSGYHKMAHYLIALCCGPKRYGKPSEP